MPNPATLPSTLKRPTSDERDPHLVGRHEVRHVPLEGALGEVRADLEEDDEGRDRRHRVRGRDAQEEDDVEDRPDHDVRLAAAPARDRVVADRADRRLDEHGDDGAKGGHPEQGVALFAHGHEALGHEAVAEERGDPAHDRGQAEPVEREPHQLPGGERAVGRPSASTPATASPAMPPSAPPVRAASAASIDRQGAMSTVAWPRPGLTSRGARGRRPPSPGSSGRSRGRSNERRIDEAGSRSSRNTKAARTRRSGSGARGIEPGEVGRGDGHPVLGREGALPDADEAEPAVAVAAAADVDVGLGHRALLRVRRRRGLAARAPVRRARQVAVAPGRDQRATPPARPAGPPVDPQPRAIGRPRTPGPWRPPRLRRQGPS